MQYEPLPGIRSFHTLQFDGDNQKAKACISPAIYYEENTPYAWKDIKIPVVKDSLNSLTRKKRDKKVPESRNNAQPKKRKSVP